MYLAIIVLPLLASIVSGLFGRKVGVNGAQFITCLCVIITTFLAIIGFSEVGLNGIPVSISVSRWLDSESLNVLWGFNFDSLTISMLIPVLVISSLVHIYSIGYMSHDPHNQRFFSYLSLFTFMMIILVTANNFLLMFVGWEGVGVCSYLLVSFWFTRIAANQSSMSAFLTNRVGDCFLTLAMFTMLWTFGNLDYSTIFSLAPYINENAVTIIGLCLLIGAMAKSSQIGLHVWLPLAMEGPTPVSALIHAATMVTAGVYLLMRSSPLIEYSSTVLIICLWVGSITTVFSSLIGLFQQDIKKVIAYSTMSQLGMMVIAVGLSSYGIALYHLVNHAFYKGLLFLGAGAVIHALADNQDFRKYGALLIFIPLTYTVMLIASFSLVAFPFMSGFYSKDLILESIFGQFKYSSTAVYYVAVIAAMFTTLYTVKVLYLTFLTNPNGSLANYEKAHEGNVFMSLPLIILALFSIFFGYITSDIFIGLATGLFTDNSLFIHPTHEIMLSTEFIVPTLYKLLPFISTVVLSICFLYIVEFSPLSLIYFKSTRLAYNIFSFFSLRFLIEFIYNKYIIRLILRLGGQTTKVLDKGFVERVGPYGLEKGLLKLSKSLSTLDTGLITSYALYILIAFMLYITMPYILHKDVSVLLLIVYTFLIFNFNSSALSETSKAQQVVGLSLKSCFSFKHIYPYIAKMYTTFISNLPFLLAISFIYMSNKFFLKFVGTELGLPSFILLFLFGTIYALLALIKKCRHSFYNFSVIIFVLDTAVGMFIAMIAGMFVVIFPMVFGNYSLRESLRLIIDFLKYEFFGLKIRHLEGLPIRPHGITNKQYATASRHVEIMNRVLDNKRSDIDVILENTRFSIYNYFKPEEKPDVLEFYLLIKKQQEDGFPLTDNYGGPVAVEYQVQFKRIDEYFRSKDLGIEPSQDCKEAYLKRKNRYIIYAKRQVQWIGPSQDFEDDRIVRKVFKEDWTDFNRVTQDLEFKNKMVDYLSKNLDKPLSTVDKELAELKYNNKKYELETEYKKDKKMLFEWSDFDWWKVNKSQKYNDFARSITPNPSYTEGAYIKLTKAALGNYTRNGKPITMSDIKTYNKLIWDSSEFDRKIAYKAIDGEVLTKSEKARLKYDFCKTKTSFYLSEVKRKFK